MAVVIVVDSEAEADAVRRDLPDSDVRVIVAEPGSTVAVSMPAPEDPWVSVARDAIDAVNEAPGFEMMPGFDDMPATSRPARVLFAKHAATIAAERGMVAPRVPQDADFEAMVARAWDAAEKPPEFQPWYGRPGLSNQITIRAFRNVLRELGLNA